MKKPLYVVGHKNPDTDSIASSIAYANYKNELNIFAKAYKNGALNSETKFLLKRFNFSKPPLIHTAKCSLMDIDIDDCLLVTKEMTMKRVLDAILKRKNKGVFVVDDEKRLIGIVSISDLTSILTVDEKVLIEKMRNVKFENIIETLQAEVLYRAKDFKTNGVIHFIPSLYSNLKIEANSIAVTGNVPDIQRHMINSNTALIIICGENWVDNVTVEMAREKGINIIHTPLSVLKTSQLIYQSPSIEKVMHLDVISFCKTETVDAVSVRIAKTRHRTYPVLDEEEKVVGSISRYHLFNYQKKEFILVDHNEESQSVNDIEYGDVIEIIDHHRIGGIETSNPIDITCKIVGSTCSIVTSKYFEKNINLTPNMAGLLLGGIISDTMNLMSPTTTKFDIEMAGRLCEVASVDKDVLYGEMVDSSDSLLNKTNQELLYEDFKEFRIRDCRIAIGQLSCKNKDEYYSVRDGLREYLKEVCNTQNYDLILIMFTSPLGTGSYFLDYGKKEWIIRDAFRDILIDDFAPNILSRKKQVLPVVIDTISK
jgi:manganese-dependent inorganic pyrophosphatase